MVSSHYHNTKYNPVALRLHCSKDDTHNKVKLNFQINQTLRFNKCWLTKIFICLFVCLNNFLL